MKLDARQAGRVLAQPGPLRAILLHGDDTGLIRERAITAVRAVAGTLDDPFRVSTLAREAHDRLDEELGALSLTGGRRVVWVREAGDALLPALKRAFATPGDTLLVLEGPGLAGRSKLKTAIEAMPDAAAIACYPEEGRALEAQVRQLLQDNGVGIDPDALTWLCARLGADRAATRGEVEKLILYAGESGRIALDDAMECSGDAAGVSLDEAAFAATIGDRPAADLAIERALGEGTSPVAVARAFLSHVNRLRLARLAMERNGVSSADAMRTLRPPVFFKRSAAFGQALSLWSAAALMRVAEQTQALELACKQTGAPDALLCRRHVASVAAQAMAEARARNRARAGA